MSSVSLRVCWGDDLTQNRPLRSGTTSEKEQIREVKRARRLTSSEDSTKLDNYQKRRPRLERLRAYVDETSRYAETKEQLPNFTYRSRIKLRKRLTESQAMCSYQERRMAAGTSRPALEGRRMRRASAPADEKSAAVDLRRTTSTPGSGENLRVVQEALECRAPGSEEDVFQPSSDESIAVTTNSTTSGAQHADDTRATPRRVRPIERFRRVVRLLSFLQKMKSSTDRKQRGQQQPGMTATVLEQLEDEAQAGVQASEEMVFDPSNFKAVKEVQLSQEAVHILSLSPYTRSEEDLQTALTALKASVSAFGEYPLKMQKRLVSVGWYERFEAKRVIIRQGHRAENFYFILSGTAIVTLLVNDNSGEQRHNTIAVLTKGSSFGELALLHHKTRSATVLCKDEVSLLAVGREDFRDIFMSYEDGKEPDHIRFLKTVPYLKDLPLDDLVTKHDLCIFHYFRRGVVIVKGGKTEWVFIVKSGSCRVLTHLAKKKTARKGGPLFTPRQQTSLPAISSNGGRRRALYTVAGHRERPVMILPDVKRPKTEPGMSKRNKADLTLPAIIGTPQKFKKTVRNVALPWIAYLSTTEGKATEAEEHRRKIEVLHKRASSLMLDKTKSPAKQDDTKSTVEEDDNRHEQVVVQIELLKPKDQFGLSSVVFDKPGVQCHLVSNGAECVLIKKSWLLQFAGESVMRTLRSQIPPYPSQETLEQKMEDQANWDSYKAQTISQLLDTLHL